MNKKRTISAVLAAALTLCSISVVSNAQTPQTTESAAEEVLRETSGVSTQASGDSFVVGDFKYTELADGTLAVLCNNTNITKAEIPATVNGKSVTSIGRSAFSGCKSLTSITIPNSVTSISLGAFYGCTSLTAINVNENNGEYCSVNGVLFNKDKTRLVQYPADKTEKSYTIPNGVISIDWYAFSDCTSLTSVTIPNSITSIDIMSFYDCTSLTSVTIPNSVTKISYYAFSGCTSLTAINVSENNGEYCSENGVLFNKDKTMLVIYPAGKTEKSYTIPNSVTSIAWYAFSDCTSLTSVTIPSSITSIGDWAFSGCTSLTSVTIPNSVTSIGYQAFYFCTSLTSVTIPNSVTSIGDHAFESCKSLTSVTIPNSVKSIGRETFSGCISLTSVTIPNSVTNIEIGAFFDCTSLANVYYTGTESEWNKISIGSDNDPLKNVNIHFNSTGPVGVPVEVKAASAVDKSSITVTASGNGANETLTIKDGLLDVSSLKPGTYTFTFSAKNCAPRAYNNITVSNGTATGLSKVELNLYGDINGDGKLTLGDVLKANAAARNSKPLTGYEANIADINGDGNITLGDVLKMNAHARNSKLLW